VPSGSIPSDQLKNLTFTDAGVGDNKMRTLLATGALLLFVAAYLQPRGAS